jgi:hypothetical protein
MEIKIRGLLVVASFGMMHAPIWSMEVADIQNDVSLIKMYTIAGLGGGGSKPDYVQSLFQDHALDIMHIETPVAVSDLGQHGCMTSFHGSLQRDDATEGVIAHATSQGAATILNYLAKLGTKERFKCLILEGALVSGNGAIIHTLAGPKGECGPIMYLPYAESWTPYLARFLRFPWYCPSGPQPIKGLSRIAKDLLVIIAHSHDDPRVPLNHALALYYGLKENGNDVYLFSKEGSRHTHVLESSDGTVIQYILKKHGKIPGDFGPVIDLTPYQPDHKQYEHYYADILAQDELHEQIAPSMYAGMVVTGIATTYVVTSSLLNMYKRTVRKK